MKIDRDKLKKVGWRILLLLFLVLSSGGVFTGSYVLIGGPEAKKQVVTTIESILTSMTGRLIFIGKKNDETPVELDSRFRGNDSPAGSPISGWDENLERSLNPEKIDKNDLVPKSMSVADGGGQIPAVMMFESSLSMTTTAGNKPKSSLPDNLEQGIAQGKIRPTTAKGLMRAGKMRAPKISRKAGSMARPVPLEQSGLKPREPKAGPSPKPARPPSLAPAIAPAALAGDEQKAAVPQPAK